MRWAAVHRLRSFYDHRNDILAISLYRIYQDIVSGAFYYSYLIAIYERVFDTKYI